MKHLSVALALLALAAQAPSKGLHVEISFTAGAHAEPVTGMVYLAISRDNRTVPIQHGHIGAFKQVQRGLNYIGAVITVGRMSPKTLPCTWPTASQSSM